MEIKYKNERLTKRQKEAHDYQWYKQKADEYEAKHTSINSNAGSVVEDYKRMKVNYDLFNNILNLSDFEYVCQPFGAEAGELPADMVNRDISSYRIKAMIGMEMRKSFDYKVLATNPEATTRKEQERFKRVKNYVVELIMAPIRAKEEAKAQVEIEGREPTPEEIQKIQQEIEEAVKDKTPDSAKKYMKRDHQDPAEIQGHHILSFLKRKLRLKDKFNKGWKHALLSAYEVYWIGIVNGKPEARVTNPIRFSCDLSQDLDFIEDGEWAVAEFRKPPSELTRDFDLNNKELDEIYENYEHRASNMNEEFFGDSQQDFYEDGNYISVKHIQFKGLRKVGWLDYIDEQTGELITEFLVDENYTIDKDNGDVYIKWEWIPETYEVWKIGKDIYKNMGPVEGQIKDPDNLKESKLSYYGAIYDRTNSIPTSVMDRMKVYQYYYNIVMYRLELLLASDDGRKILMNINAVPSTMGVQKWQHFMKSSPFLWFNTEEEGMANQDVNTVAKEINLSLASDISKYINILEYLEEKCGKSIGVTDPVLGQVSPSEKVTNNQQSLVQTQYMLEPYFDLHNQVKKNVMQGLLDTGKVAFSREDAPEYLNYIADDMSVEMFKINKDLLASETLGLFVEDSTSADEVKESLERLAHAAMQNQTVELSDVIKVIKSDSLTTAEEELTLGEQKKAEKEQEKQEREHQQNLELEDKKEELAKKDHERTLEEIRVKEEEKRETDIAKQTILAAGFNENKDMDNDGELDVLEIARDGVNADIQIREQKRKDLELAHKIKDDERKNELKEKEIKNKKSTSKA